MTDVVMPQMGESIIEGTLTRWLKKPGDKVERDEPLFEISTDKVDTEIPSPVAGVLSEVLVQEGATVAINTVVARIGDGAARTAPVRAAAAPQQEARQTGTSAAGSADSCRAVNACLPSGSVPTSAPPARAQAPAARLSRSAAASAGPYPIEPPPAPPPPRTRPAS